MSEKKSIEQPGQDASELTEKDLDNLAGGVSGNDGGCIPQLPIIIGRPPVKLPPSGF